MKFSMTKNNFINNYEEKDDQDVIFKKKPVCLKTTKPTDFILNDVYCNGKNYTRNVCRIRVRKHRGNGVTVMPPSQVICGARSGKSWRKPTSKLASPDKRNKGRNMFASYARSHLTNQYDIAIYQSNRRRIIRENKEKRRRSVPGIKSVSVSRRRLALRFNKLLCCEFTMEQLYKHYRRNFNLPKDLNRITTSHYDDLMSQCPINGVSQNCSVYRHLLSDLKNLLIRSGKCPNPGPGFYCENDGNSGWYCESYFTISSYIICDLLYLTMYSHPDPLLKYIAIHMWYAIIFTPSDLYSMNLVYRVVTHYIVELCVKTTYRALAKMRVAIFDRVVICIVVNSILLSCYRSAYSGEWFSNGVDRCTRILLLMSGIEPNPGPFTKPACKNSGKSLTKDEVDFFFIPQNQFPIGVCKECGGGVAHTGDGKYFHEYCEDTDVPNRTVLAPSNRQPSAGNKNKQPLSREDKRQMSGKTKYFQNKVVSSNSLSYAPSCSRVPTYPAPSAPCVEPTPENKQPPVSSEVLEQIELVTHKPSEPPVAPVVPPPSPPLVNSSPPNPPHSGGTIGPIPGGPPVPPRTGGSSEEKKPKIPDPDLDGFHLTDEQAFKLLIKRSKLEWASSSPYLMSILHGIMGIINSRTVIGYVANNRVVSNRGVEETKQNHVVASIKFDLPVLENYFSSFMYYYSYTRNVIFLFSLLMLFSNLFMRISIINFVFFRVFMAVISVRLWQFFIGHSLVSNIYKDLSMMQLHYCPHICSNVVAEYDHKQDLDLVRSTIRMRLRRLATLPLRDVDYLHLITGSEIVSLCLIEDSPFLSGGLPSLMGVP
jgi:hypothetical protein